MKEINLDDIIAMAQTIRGESRNQPYQGMVLVGRVIYNRAIKRNTSIWHEVHRAKQFSCWNQNDPNLYYISKTKVSDMLVEMRAALEALDELTDFTAGLGLRFNTITHYHTKSIKPYWAKGKKPAITVGDHVFYDNID